MTEGGGNLDRGALASPRPREGVTGSNEARISGTGIERGGKDDSVRTDVDVLTARDS